MNLTTPKRLAAVLILSTALNAWADYDTPNTNKEGAIKASGAYRQEFDRRMEGKTGFENINDGISRLRDEMSAASAREAAERAKEQLKKFERPEDTKPTGEEIANQYGGTMLQAMVDDEEDQYFVSMDWARAFGETYRRASAWNLAYMASRVRVLQSLLGFKTIKLSHGASDDFPNYTVTRSVKLKNAVRDVEDLIKAEKKGKFNEKGYLFTPEAAYVLGKLYMYGFESDNQFHRGQKVEVDEEKAFEYFNLASSYMYLPKKATQTRMGDEVWSLDPQKNHTLGYMTNMVIQSSYELIRCYRDGVGTKKDLTLAKKIAADVFEQYGPFLRGKPDEFLLNKSAVKANEAGAAVLARSGIADVKEFVEPEFFKFMNAPKSAPGAAAAPKGPVPGQVIEGCPDCPAMVVIPPGSFTMGSDFNGPEAPHFPPHKVTIFKAFALGKTEVTQGQWKAVMGNRPSKNKNCGFDCPVENITWDDVQIYLKKLNAKSGRNYRLPSEAEFEYSCRSAPAGTNQYCGSNGGQSTNNPSNPVMGFKANSFGLYDLCGNVREWVADTYHRDYIGAPTDGSAWTGTDKEHVIRSVQVWDDRCKFLRNGSYRGEQKDEHLGFRVAETLD